MANVNGSGSSMASGSWAASRSWSQLDGSLGGEAAVVHYTGVKLYYVLFLLCFWIIAARQPCCCVHGQMACMRRAVRHSGVRAG